MLSVEELNDRLIDLAFAEDIGDGDHTTLCCIPADAESESKLLIKEEGIFASNNSIFILSINRLILSLSLSINKNKIKRR